MAELEMIKDQLTTDLVKFKEETLLCHSPQALSLNIYNFWMFFFYCFMLLFRLVQPIYSIVLFYLIEFDQHE